MFLATDARISTDFSDGLTFICGKSVEIRASVAFSCPICNWTGCLGTHTDMH
ncbi:MAG: hypothetical protein K9G46_01085 [Flavobacteriales bacterium]|nr:hypothetical protein [Flavobacteriales bacterium]